MTKQQLRTTITARAMQQRTYTYINTHINMRWYIFALTNRMNMNMYPCFYWFNAADAPCSYEIFLPRPQPPHASSQKVRHRSQRTNCDNLYENDVHMYVHPIYHIQSYVNLYRVYKYVYMCVHIWTCKAGLSAAQDQCACVSWRQLQLCVGVSVCSCNWTVKLLSADAPRELPTIVSKLWLCVYK